MANASKKDLYRVRCLCLLFSLCFSLSFCQSLDFPLRSAGIEKFGNHVYCYGFQQKNNKQQFTIFRLNPHLKKTDSLSYELDQYTDVAQSSCWSDSLHGLFNIYVPVGGEKGFNIFRYNKNFELVAQASKVESGRLNSLAGFDNTLHYDGNFVYAIKSKKDSSGIQFFLNKFRLKEDLKTFDYEQVWQFPFERKHIRYTKVIYSDRDLVFLYVMIADGEKSGQWILRLNARNGYLLRGSKLNEKGEEQSYLYGSSFYSKREKSLILIGHKFTSKQFSPVTEMLGAASSTVLGIFLLELDSLGEKKNKKELKWPILENKSSGKKTTGTYLLQFSPILEKSPGQYSVNADVFKNSAGSSCYVYGNSFGFSFKRSEEELVSDKKTVSSDVQIDSYLFSPDKLDMNGKLCADSGLSLPRLLNKKASLPVKLIYELDSLGRPFWILSKSLIKKGNVQFHFLKAGKKNYELSLIEEISKTKNPKLILLNSKVALLGRQESEYNFRINSVRLP